MTEYCSVCGGELVRSGASLTCAPCDRVWSTAFPPSMLRPDLRPDIVRCGCGVVRNDEDAAVPLAVAAHSGQVLFWNATEFEAPRACRRCGSVYVLPRPRSPTEPT